MYCNGGVTPTRRLPPVRSFMLKHMHLCAIHVCFIRVIMTIIIIIHHHNNRKDTVRFGSVRNLCFPGSTRFGLRFSDTPWIGPVRFGSVPRPVPAGSGIKRFGSVRPIRFDFSFLPYILVIIEKHNNDNNNNNDNSGNTIIEQ